MKTKFHKYCTDIFNLKKYGPPPKPPVFSCDPLPTPPRDNYVHSVPLISSP